MPPTALVTGAASGIGKATARALAQKGFDVTLLVRDEAKGKATREEIRRLAPKAKVDVLVADLSSQAQIRAAASRFLKEHDRLDVLVNAAGVFLPNRVVTEDGLEATFATNVVPYFLLTNLLVPALKRAAPSRVVNVASRYGGTKIKLDDLQTAQGTYSYFRSTPRTMVGRVLVTQELAERLKENRIAVNAVHPGLVSRTQLLAQTGGWFRWMTNTFGTTPEKGADTVVWLATEPAGAEETGKLWHKRKPMKTPGQGSDAAFRKRYLGELERFVATSEPRSKGVKAPKRGAARKR